MFFPASGWFVAFVLTIALEVPIAAFLLRRADPDLLRLGILIFFANLATHPIVWYVIPQVLLIDTPGYALAAETWAVAAEALLYWAAIRGLSARRAIGASLLANAASFAVGWAVGERWPDLFR